MDLVGLTHGTDGIAGTGGIVGTDGIVHLGGMDTDGIVGMTLGDGTDSDGTDGMIHGTDGVHLPLVLIDSTAGAEVSVASEDSEEDSVVHTGAHLMCRPRSSTTTVLVEEVEEPLITQE